MKPKYCMKCPYALESQQVVTSIEEASFYELTLNLFRLSWCNNEDCPLNGIVVTKFLDKPRGATTKGGE